MPIPFKTIISLALVVALGPAGIDMYLASMPDMAQELNTTYAATQITLSVFLIFMGVGQLFFGPISDALGRKVPLMVGLTAYVLASLWAALATSIESLIFARVFQGLGAAMAVVIIMSMVRDLVDDLAATQLYALLNTIVALGPIVAPAIGGLIGTAYGWRGVMVALMTMSALVLLNSIWNIQETLAKENRIQLNLKTVCQNYWNILKNKFFLCNLFALSAVYFFLFAYIGGSSFVYQNDFGLSVGQFGLVFGLTSISLVIGASASALLVKKISELHLAILGAVFMMLGSMTCLVMYFVSDSIIGVVSGIALGLFGLGILEVVLMAIAMNSQKTALGSCAALLGAFPLLLASIATPIAGQLVEMNTFYWLVFLAIVGPIILALVFFSARSANIRTADTV